MSKSNNYSSSIFNINRIKVANEDKTKQEEIDDKENTTGVVTAALNGLNPSNSMKTIHITNGRPKSMDISKYFQVIIFNKKNS